MEKNAGVGAALLWFFLVAMVVSIGLALGGAIGRKIA